MGKSFNIPALVQMANKELIFYLHYGSRMGQTCSLHRLGSRCLIRAGETAVVPAALQTRVPLIICLTSSSCLEESMRKHSGIRSSAQGPRVILSASNNQTNGPLFGKYFHIHHFSTVRHQTSGLTPRPIRQWLKNRCFLK